MKSILMTLILVVSTHSSYACNPSFTFSGFNVGEQQFVTADDQIINGGGINEKEFDDALERIRNIYAPIFKDMGAELVINKYWDDNTVNAFARREGNLWKINMYGGYARHPENNIDGMLALACHEIGHHVGGTPHYTLESWEWATAEGQADYFTTLKCLRKIMENDDNETIVSKMTVSPYLQEQCDQAYSSSSEQALCVRTSQAGFVMTSVWMGGSSKIDFSTPDTSQTTETFYHHPDYQCRVDTYLQGSLCEEDPYQTVSNETASMGTCNLATGHNSGLRPACWYKEVEVSAPFMDALLF